MLLRTIALVYRRERAAGGRLSEIAAEKWRLARRIGLREAVRNFDRYTPELTPSIRQAPGLRYAQWIERVEAVYLAQLRAPERKSPVHLVVVLAADPAADGLQETLDSVAALPGVAGLRVLVATATENAVPPRWHDRTLAGVSELQRELSALKPQPEAVTLVRAGWRLTPAFPVAVTAALQEKSAGPVLIYSDHDHLDPDSARADPVFKPDWSPDYLLEYDYIGGVLAASPQLIVSAIPEQCTPPSLLPWVLAASVATGHIQAKVLHLPFALCHQTADAAPQPAEPKRAWLRTHLGTRAEVTEGPGAALSRVKYPPPEPAPRVDIIVPTRDRLDLLRCCIDSIGEQTRYPAYRIIVVDNQSEKETTRDYLEQLRANDEVRVLEYDHPFNFSAINNHAVAHSDAPLICFLNNDIEIVDPDWLSELVGYISQPGVGCVGAKLAYPDGRVQHGGVLLGVHGVAAHAFAGAPANAAGYEHRLETAQDYSAVTAACLLTRKDLFEALGGFNARALPVAFNDIDYCLRVGEQGLRVVWTPHTRLIHHESASRVPESERTAEFEDEIRFMRTRWGHLLDRDPAYSPHLALDGRSFTLSDRWLADSPSSAAAAAGRPPKEQMYAFEDNRERIRSVLDSDRGTTEASRDALGLDIVILNLDKPELIGPQLNGLADAKRRLEQERGVSTQIVVGDTGSSDPRVAEIYRHHADGITVEYGMKYHFSRCNNQLFDSHAHHRYVLFLNNDVFFSDPAAQLGALLSTAEQRPDIGVFGTRLMYPDGRLQHAGIAIHEQGELDGLCYHPRHGERVGEDEVFGRIRLFPAVTGACLMMPSDLFIHCGGFDEGYQAEAQDVDLCLKVRRLGRPSALVELGRVVHIENATRPKGDANAHDRARFVRRWAFFTKTMRLAETLEDAPPRDDVSAGAPLSVAQGMAPAAH
jgi:GT2 family glycosyltransferase